MKLRYVNIFVSSTWDFYVICLQKNTKFEVNKKKVNSKESEGVEPWSLEFALGKYSGIKALMCRFKHFLLYWKYFWTLKLEIARNMVGFP